MRKNDTKLTFEIPRQRTRAHVVLFCANSPFKPKTVKSKKSYQRRAKHAKSNLEQS